MLQMAKNLKQDFLTNILYVENNATLLALGYMSYIIFIYYIDHWNRVSNETAHYKKLKWLLEIFRVTLQFIVLFDMKVPESAPQATTSATYDKAGEKKLHIFIVILGQWLLHARVNAIRLSEITLGSMLKRAGSIGALLR